MGGVGKKPKKYIYARGNVGKKIHARENVRKKKFMHKMGLILIFLPKCSSSVSSV